MCVFITLFRRKSWRKRKSISFRRIGLGREPISVFFNFFFPGFRCENCDRHFQVYQRCPRLSTTLEMTGSAETATRMPTTTTPATTTTETTDPVGSKINRIDQKHRPVLVVSLSAVLSLPCLGWSSRTIANDFTDLLKNEKGINDCKLFLKQITSLYRIAI